MLRLPSESAAVVLFWRRARRPPLPEGRMKKVQRPTGRILALAMGALAALGYAGVSLASDHQDTPEVEVNQRLDITDVWAFPGSSDDRIVLGLTIGSPIVAGTDLRFDPNALYQIKVDNNQDGREDLVFQFSFDDRDNGAQT